MKFICGDSFQEKAGIILDNVYKGVNGELYLPESLKGEYKHNDIIFYEKKDGDANVIFCRTELLPLLDAGIDFSDYILITHNSDVNINQEIQLHTRPKLWLAQNGNHPSVVTIPLGLENKRFGKWEMFTDLRKESIPKDQMLYLNVSPYSNPAQRYQCIIRAQSFGISNDFQQGVEDYYANQLRYLKQLKRSYFVLCPEGAGIDTHRTFEALYSGAIPIVTRSRVTEQLSRTFPLVILDSWEDFHPSTFTQGFYQELWKPELVENLDFDIYFNKLVK